jgi:hypothetical protein
VGSELFERLFVVSCTMRVIHSLVLNVLFHKQGLEADAETRMSLLFACVMTFITVRLFAMLNAGNN